MSFTMTTYIDMLFIRKLIELVNPIRTCVMKIIFLVRWWFFKHITSRIIIIDFDNNMGTDGWYLLFISN